MRIVTWNCNGALRTKFNYLNSFDADIYLVQECENPENTKHIKYLNWAENFLWVDDKGHKGLGIFAKKGIELKLLDWSNKHEGEIVKHFLPCLIDRRFQLIGVWTHKNNSKKYAYIGQLWKYLQENYHNLGRTIIAGDFNSNAIWDKKARWWNHTDVVNQLAQENIESLYHKYFNEIQGMETQPTFYMHRKEEKPYHIDYIFSSKSLSESLAKVEIGNFKDWIKHSDHLPLSVEL